MGSPATPGSTPFDMDGAIHGVRGGNAMIVTLRRRLIAVPGRPIRHARHLILRLPPSHGLLPEVLARLRDVAAPA
jgi:hypothetical protein